MQGNVETDRGAPSRHAGRSWLFRYGVAVGCAAAGLLIALQTVPVLHSSTVFLAAVVIASWFGGPGPGLLTAVLATWVVEYLLHSAAPLVHADTSADPETGGLCGPGPARRLGERHATESGRFTPAGP